MAGGRQERTGGPAGRGGPHPKGRNEEEEPGAAGVAARRGGTTGERATNRQTGAAGTSASARTRAVRLAEQGSARPRQTIVIRMDRDAAERLGAASAA